MNYIDNAAQLWHRFWCNRFSMLSTGLNAINVGVMLCIRPPVSVRMACAVAVLAAAASAASLYARQVAQPKLYEDSDA